MDVSLRTTVKSQVTSHSSVILPFSRVSPSLCPGHLRQPTISIPWRKPLHQHPYYIILIQRNLHCQGWCLHLRRWCCPSPNSFFSKKLNLVDKGTQLIILGHQNSSQGVATQERRGLSSIPRTHRSVQPQVSQKCQAIISLAAKNSLFFNFIITYCPASKNYKCYVLFRLHTCSSW